MKTHVQSTFNITQDAFIEMEVWFLGIMHVETDLLNSICKVWSNQSEILKRSSKTAILYRIGNLQTFHSGEFGLGVNRCSSRVAFRHTSTL